MQRFFADHGLSEGPEQEFGLGSANSQPGTGAYVRRRVVLRRRATREDHLAGRRDVARQRGAGGPVLSDVVLRKAGECCGRPVPCSLPSGEP
jgi:hypothetical protein